MIVVFDSEKSTQRICEMIESAGLAVCLPCRSGDEARRAAAKHEVSLVVSGFRLSDGTGEALAEDLPATTSLLMVATQHQLDMVSDDILRLPAPISRSDLVTSVRMVLQMSRRVNRLIRPRRSDQEEDVIRQAKALLMDRNGFTEDQAHRYLQKKSMDTGVRMIQTARLILGDL